MRDSQGIFGEQGDFVTFLHVNGDVAKHLFAVKATGEIVDFEDFLARFPLRLKKDVWVFAIGGLNVVEVELLKHFFAGSRLTRLGDVGAESLDEFLQFFALVFDLLVAVSSLAQGELRSLIPEGIVACVKLDFAKVNVADVGTHHVEEVPVMGNDEDEVFKFCQEILQPHDGFDVEVVGRLIKQQDVGIAKEGLSEEYPDLLFSVERGDLLGVEVFGDS